MRKILCTIVLFQIVNLFAFADNFQLKSPDGKIVLNVLVDREVVWNASYEGNLIIDSTKIGMRFLDGTSWCVDANKPKVKSKRLTETVIPSVPHKNSKIDVEYEQLTLMFEGKYNLLFRAYNDGVAYRFVNTSKSELLVLDEQMNIKFPEGTMSYFPQEERMYSHNERLYLYKSITDIKEGDFCSLPVLFETDNATKVLFTETALHNYPCMFLKGDDGLAFETQFPSYVLKTVPEQGRGSDRNQTIKEQADYIAKISTEDIFPWRVFIIGNDKDLVESNLSYVLAEPCKLDDTEWIKPGKVAWDWYNDNNIFGVDFKAGINNDTYKYYIDFASENGIEYVILDEGWTKSTTNILECTPDIDVQKLIEYAAAKNVGIILWVLWKPLDVNTTEILETYAGWGAIGVKVDFMQRSDQYMVHSYEKIAKECARLHLLVDYHGAFKPSGLRRAYPNIVNYEGVKGSENNKWSADITPEHNVTLPFIRMAAGPLDYTPGCMRNARLENHKISHYRPMSLGTRAHQVAMYVVYEAPLQMMCENPSIYKEEQECVDFIVQIPTVWDETILLDGKVADYILIARRKGVNWYIGAMTDWDARTLNVDLSFLADGEYTMEMLKDGINASRYAEDYSKDKKKVSSSSTFEIELASGGGWTAICKPVNE